MTVFILQAYKQFQSTPPRRWWPLGAGVEEDVSYFNPHHHAGGDDTGPGAEFGHNEFQSTPPRRWWRKLSVMERVTWNFNPHHHAGGDKTEIWDTKGGTGDFNPHHHAGGDGVSVNDLMPGNEFQSTPPRRWWHRHPGFHGCFWPISIHTTTQVVTELTHGIAAKTEISIHTTTQVVTIYPGLRSFHQQISIHTTTQVVTELSTIQKRENLFQSTPPRRWWRSGRRSPGRMPSFQSTPPRRWWLGLDVGDIDITRFQSTPPRRWWQINVSVRTGGKEFQSTPPRRWWRGVPENSLHRKYFNPHHHAGGDYKKVSVIKIL